MLLGILLMLIFMLPILYVIFSNATKERKRTNTVKALCRKQQVNVQNLEFVGNTIIGMDNDFKFLVIADRLNIDQTFQLIPLADLKSCAVKAIRVKNKTLDTVELDLIGKDFSKEVIFYKEDDEMNTTDSEACLNDAVRWEKSLRQRMQLA